jgi:hypothetical protein
VHVILIRWMRLNRCDDESCGSAANLRRPPNDPVHPLFFKCAWPRRYHRLPSAVVSSICLCLCLPLSVPTVTFYFTCIYICLRPAVHILQREDVVVVVPSPHFPPFTIPSVHPLQAPLSVSAFHYRPLPSLLIHSLPHLLSFLPIIPSVHSPRASFPPTQRNRNLLHPTVHHSLSLSSFTVIITVYCHRSLFVIHCCCHGSLSIKPCHGHHRYHNPPLLSSYITVCRYPVSSIISALHCLCLHYLPLSL